MNRSYLGMLLTGLGLILVLPPFPFGCAAFIVFIPFLFFLENRNNKEAFWGGYLVGLIWSLGTLYWIGWATVPGVIGSVFFQGFYFGLFGLIQAFLFRHLGKKSWLTIPFVYVGIELLLSSGEMGFPWNLVGHSLTGCLELIQFASIGGVYSISFGILTINTLLFAAMKLPVKKHKIILLSSATGLILFSWIYGSITMNRDAISEKSYDVALVQGNVDPYRRWTPNFVDSSFQTYEILSSQLQGLPLDLMIWPESASPCYLDKRYSCRKRVRNKVHHLNVPILTGAPDFNWKDGKKLQVYNSAFLIEPGVHKIQKYDKVHLVPFSERIPFLGGIKPVYNALKKMIMDIGDFAPGDSMVVFTSQNDDRTLTFSCGICFDSVFPYFMRKFVKNGAEFLVIITNDGWFGKTSGPYQHAAIAAMRAVENRSWVARCANTGISAFYDPYGRIQSQTDLFTREVLVGEVSPIKKRTFFTLYGEWFPAIIFAGNFFIAGWVILILRRMKSRSE